MMIQRLLIFFSLLCTSISAQNLYDSDKLSINFHASRRAALREKMGSKSISFVFSNPIRNRANDVDFKFSQDPNFYYLTGLTEPDAVLIIFSEPLTLDSITTNELLYIQPKNPKYESWTGRRLGITGASKELGIKYVLNNFDFRDLKVDYASYSRIFHSEIFNDIRDDNQDPGDLYSLVHHFQDKTDKFKEKRDQFGFSVKMAELREIKEAEEIKLLRKAVDITCDSHLELMKALEANMTEYQSQAIVEFGFTFNGAEYVGYPSIVGAGENSCILHYITNRKKFENKDFMVVDAGAEYHGYTADVTRTLPVNGKFSEEQKAIYNIVLEAQNAGIRACKSGNTFREPHNMAVEVIKEGLKKLGIIKDGNDFAKYFFHGTSHYLGLDVHDPGTYQRLKPGQVITVEPGIYIPADSPCDPKWWNIGVRIEDDVLITEGAPDVLSIKLPKTIEEIEKIMAEPGFLKKN